MSDGELLGVKMMLRAAIIALLVVFWLCFYQPYALFGILAVAWFYSRRAELRPSTMPLLKAYGLATWTLLFIVSVAHAQLVNENLLVRVPKDYKIDHQAKNAREQITEMVPQAESVKNWTEMVTVQIFFGHKASLPQAQNAIADGWIKACPQGARIPVADTTENGYPVSLWQLSCPKLATTGKPEWTYFKAVRGNDSLFIVQKAFRFEPSKEQLTTWMLYLKSVSVCDSRRPASACPKTN